MTMTIPYNSEQEFSEYITKKIGEPKEWMIACFHYRRAQLSNTLGCKQYHIRRGILSFNTIENAIVDAVINIRRNTRSDFSTARFYEDVKDLALDIRARI